MKQKKRARGIIYRCSRTTEEVRFCSVIIHRCRSKLCPKECLATCTFLQWSGSAYFSLFLTPAYVICGKVVFSLMSVCLSLHGGWVSHVTYYMGTPFCLSVSSLGMGSHVTYYMGTPFSPIPDPLPHWDPSTPRPVQTCHPLNLLASGRLAFNWNAFLFYFSVEVELACIADWKDGSDMFMYGRLTAPTLLEDHTKYRCFVSLFSFQIWFFKQIYTKNSLSIFLFSTEVSLFRLHAKYCKVLIETPHGHINFVVFFNWYLIWVSSYSWVRM